MIASEEAIAQDQLSLAPDRVGCLHVAYPRGSNTILKNPVGGGGALVVVPNTTTGTSEVLWVIVNGDLVNVNDTPTDPARRILGAGLVMPTA